MKCRFCAEYLGLLDCSEFLEVSQQYLKMYKSFTDYMDITDTFLPKAACGACFNKFNLINAFYEKVKQSQIVLRGLYVPDFEASKGDNVETSIMQQETIATAAKYFVPHPQNVNLIASEIIHVKKCKKSNERKGKKVDTNLRKISEHCKSQTKMNTYCNTDSVHASSNSPTGYRNDNIIKTHTHRQPKVECFIQHDKLEFSPVGLSETSSSNEKGNYIKREPEEVVFDNNIVEECLLESNTISYVTTDCKVYNNSLTEYEPLQSNERVKVSIKYEPIEIKIEDNVTSDNCNTNDARQVSEEYGTCFLPSYERYTKTISEKSCIAQKGYADSQDQHLVDDSYSNAGYSDSQLDKDNINVTITTAGDSWSSYKWVCRHCVTEFENMTELRTHSKEVHKICYAFKCADCDKQYNDFNNFIEHVRQHREGLRYYCQYCNEKFDECTKCEAHALTHEHKVQKICSRCGEIVPNATCLEGHKRTYNNFNVPEEKVPKMMMPDSENDGTSSWEDYQWNCQECNVRMPDMAALRTHTQVSHSKCFVMKCMDCSEVATHFATFVEHVRRHRPYLKKYCQFCNQCYDDTNDLNKHEAKHIYGPIKPCDFCGQIFKSQSSLIQHMDNYNPSFKCGVCGKIYNDKDSFKYHIDSHYFWFLCNVCDEPHDSVDGCVKHTAEEHGTSVARHEVRTLSKIDVTTCRLKYKRQTSVTITNYFKINKSSDKTYYQCNLCAKRFINTSSLRSHISSHLNLKEYSCEICSKSFNTNKLRNAHVLRHGMRFVNGQLIPVIKDDKHVKSKAKKRLKRDMKEDEKKIKTSTSKTANKKSRTQKNLTRTGDFICNVCSKPFNTSMSLKRHIVIHKANRTREFACLTCGKTYMRKDFLVQHAQKTKHTIAGRPCVCDVCGNSYQYKTNLERHMLEHAAVT